MLAEQSDAPREGGALRRVVVGYDHHQSSASALVVAMSMASEFRAGLRVVHVVDLDDAYPNVDDPDWEVMTQKTIDAQRRTAEAALEAFPGPWTYQTSRGQAARVLARIAEEEDAVMIVIGERRAGPASAVAHLLERSVLHHLLHVRPCAPILVVPERAAAHHACPPRTNPTAPVITATSEGTCS